MNNIKSFRNFVLNENEDLLNSILDKISAHGIESLSPREHEFLNNQQQGVADTELENRIDVDNGSEFRSAKDPLLSFSFHNSAEEDYYIVHMGVLHVSDADYPVAILCHEEDGSFSHLHFDDEEIDVNGIGDMQDEAEEFLQYEVCPVLSR